MKEAMAFVARELGISRKILHEWIKAWKADRPDGLNRQCGPKAASRKMKQLATYNDSVPHLPKRASPISSAGRPVS